MSSHFGATAPRRIPRQQRGRRRVECLLRAAESVIAESGYDAATVCAIVRRARCAVGSLYQFFPNKNSLVEELRRTYIQEHEALWNELTRKSASLSPERLAARLVDFPLALARRHPAFLPLLDLPPSANSQCRRGVIRDRIASVLRAASPRLSGAEASRVAAVIQQIIRSCLTLYARANIQDRRAIVVEFKLVLAGYLRVRLCRTSAALPRIERLQSGNGRRGGNGL